MWLQSLQSPNLDSVIDEVNDPGFFFDTEFLVRIRKKGFQILEFPVQWIEPRVSCVHENPITMLSKLVKLWFRMMN